MSRQQSRHGARIFAIPALLFAVSSLGLIAALLVEDWSDVLWALAAGSGLLALIWARLRRSQR